MSFEKVQASVPSYHSSLRVDVMLDNSSVATPEAEVAYSFQLMLA